MLRIWIRAGSAGSICFGPPGSGSGSGSNRTRYGSGSGCVAVQFLLNHSNARMPMLCLCICEISVGNGILFGTVSVIPQKEVFIPRHSEVHGRVKSETLNGTELCEKNSLKTAKITYTELRACFLPRNASEQDFASLLLFLFHGSEFWVVFSSVEWFRTEFREFVEWLSLHLYLPALDWRWSQFIIVSLLRCHEFLFFCLNWHFEFFVAYNDLMQTCFHFTLNALVKPLCIICTRP